MSKAFVLVDPTQPKRTRKKKAKREAVDVREATDAEMSEDDRRERMPGTSRVDDVESGATLHHTRFLSFTEATINEGDRHEQKRRVLCTACEISLTDIVPHTAMNIMRRAKKSRTSGPIP